MGQADYTNPTAVARTDLEQDDAVSVTLDVPDDSDLTHCDEYDATGIVTSPEGISGVVTVCVNDTQIKLYDGGDADVLDLDAGARHHAAVKSIARY